ncbi:hypothetical protein KEM54_004657 [Ascosphaera aggregata]|nr:hypothetical protein KEM54_004657 [Ascosphaera aggregata]
MASIPNSIYRYPSHPQHPQQQQQQQNQNQNQIQSHMSAAKTRQYAQLHSQLAQLNTNLTDTENLVRMTAVQAGDLRFLGAYMGALFMGAAKVLGEEGVAAANATAGTAAQSSSHSASQSHGGHGGGSAKDDVVVVVVDVEEGEGEEMQ